MMWDFTTLQNSPHSENSWAFNIFNANMLTRYVENREILCVILGTCGSDVCHKESDGAIFWFSF